MEREREREGEREGERDRTSNTRKIGREGEREQLGQIESTISSVALAKGSITIVFIHTSTCLPGSSGPNDQCWN